MLIMQLGPLKQTPTKAVARMVSDPSALQLGRSSKSRGTNDECFTPPEVFSALAIRFNLDVAAPPGGVPWVPADRYYTAEDNALAQEWKGSVWMNAPFSKMKHFVPRFMEHANGIALVGTSDGKWHRELWEDERTTWTRLDKVRFIKPDGQQYKKHLPTVVWLVAYGEECSNALRRIGKVKS